MIFLDLNISFEVNLELIIMYQHLKKNILLIKQSDTCTYYVSDFFTDSAICGVKITVVVITVRCRMFDRGETGQGLCFIVISSIKTNFLYFFSSGKQPGRTRFVIFCIKHCSFYLKCALRYSFLNLFYAISFYEKKILKTLYYIVLH